MIDGFVADSSIGVAWVVKSQASEPAERLLDEIAAGHKLVVPVLWMFEVANALLILERRKRVNSEEAKRARHLLNRLNPLIDEEGARRAMEDVTHLARAHALTVYDGTYLELARRRRLPLASRDAALNKAARAEGIRTLA